MSKNFELKYMIEKLFPSKVYTLDILYDLKLMISIRLKQFQHNVDEFEKCRAEEYLKEMSEFVKSPRKYEFPNRLYVISGVQFVGVACLDLSDKAIQNIIYDLQKELYDCEPFPVNRTEVNLINTVYIFHESTPVFWRHIDPAYAALISQTLSTKNIVNFGLKNRWTVKD